MKIRIEKIKIANPEQFIMRCGYGKLNDRNTGQTSYIRRLQKLFFPRFHVYMVEEADVYVYNLHLDQKRPIYENVTAHSGEYDGEVVEREAERIKSYIANNIG